MMLLLCVERAGALGDDLYQALAGGIFAAAFVLFSASPAGFGPAFQAGVIRLCKVAEIAVMLAGMLAFAMNSIAGLMVVLFLMARTAPFSARRITASAGDVSQQRLTPVPTA